MPPNSTPSYTPGDDFTFGSTLGGDFTADEALARHRQLGKRIRADQRRLAKARYEAHRARAGGNADIAARRERAILEIAARIYAQRDAFFEFFLLGCKDDNFTQEELMP